MEHALKQAGDITAWEAVMRAVADLPATASGLRGRSRRGQTARQSTRNIAGPCGCSRAGTADDLLGRRTRTAAGDRRHIRSGAAFTCTRRPDGSDGRVVGDCCPAQAAGSPALCPACHRGEPQRRLPSRSLAESCVHLGRRKRHLPSSMPEIGLQQIWIAITTAKVMHSVAFDAGGQAGAGTGRLGSARCGCWSVRVAHAGRCACGLAATKPARAKRSPIRNSDPDWTTPNRRVLPAIPAGSGGVDEHMSPSPQAVGRRRRQGMSAARHLPLLQPRGPGGGQALRRGVRGGGAVGVVGRHAALGRGL